MLNAYFDLSGKEKCLISSVAGYMAHIDVWKDIEREWSDILNKAGIDYFRYSDIHYTLGKEKGDLCIDHLRNVIEGSPLISIGSALVEDHWNMDDWGDIQTEKLGSPYLQCLDASMDNVGLFCKEKGFEDEIKIICCLDDKEENIRSIFDRNSAKHQQIVDFSAGISKRVIPLQCADLAAGLLRASWIDIGYEESQDPWGSMPQGSGGGRLSFWSLNPGTVLRRALRIMTDDGEAK